MDDVHFEWDPTKARANLRKHGVSFEEAQTAFADEFALVVEDRVHSETEDRFILLGPECPSPTARCGPLLSDSPGRSSPHLR